MPKTTRRATKPKPHLTIAVTAKAKDDPAVFLLDLSDLLSDASKAVREMDYNRPPREITVTSRIGKATLKFGK